MLYVFTLDINSQICLEKYTYIRFFSFALYATIGVVVDVTCTFLEKQLFSENEELLCLQILVMVSWLTYRFSGVFKFFFFTAVEYSMRICSRHKCTDFFSGGKCLQQLYFLSRYTAKGVVNRFWQCDARFLRKTADWIALFTNIGDGPLISVLRFSGFLRQYNILYVHVFALDINWQFFFWGKYACNSSIFFRVDLIITFWRRDVRLILEKQLFVEIWEMFCLLMFSMAKI